MNAVIARHRLFEATVLTALALLCLSAGPARAQGLPGTVSRVIEGDRLVLQGPGSYQRTVRMAGIDAPERGQPYAEQSEGRLARRLSGRFVVIDAYGRDAQGQILGRVTYGGEDMNLAQVADGMAWFDPHTAALLSPLERERYAAAEKAARRGGLGLWGQTPAVPPWSWRDSGVSPAPWRMPAPGGQR
jgi:endonuclease YncB( thermonuclease family)